MNAHMQSRRRRPVQSRDLVAPTPERIAKSDGGYVITRDGFMRITQAPLDMLHARQCLDREDVDGNRVLFAAGDRYRGDWYRGGLSGHAGVNLAATGQGAGHPAYSIPSTETVAAFRAMWRQAYRALDDEDARTVVGLVVLDEMSLRDAGRAVLQRKLGDKHTRAPGRDRSIAWAADLLRSGLRCLAEHYGMAA